MKKLKTLYSVCIDNAAPLETFKFFKSFEFIGAVILAVQNSNLTSLSNHNIKPIYQRLPLEYHIYNIITILLYKSGSRWN